MTHDEIIEMAEQAKAIPMHKDFNQLALIGNENIEAFAKLIAEKAFDEGYSIGELAGFKEGVKLERKIREQA